MASTTGTIAFLLTNYLNRAKLTYLTNRISPFYTKVKKSLASGDNVATPAVFNNPQGTGSSYTQAAAGASQASGGNLKGVKWLSTFGDYDAVVQIGDKAIKASRDNAGSFMRDKQAEIDGLYKKFGKVMANYFLNGPGHTMTPGGFTISSGVCTCADPNDTYNVEVGQIFNVSAGNADNGTDILIAASADGFVTGVDRNLGTFTVSATSGGSTATPTNWTGTMFAFQKSDFGGAGATRIVLGLGAWVPAAAPAATGFETTIDRTQDIVSLSGTRLTAAEQQGLNNQQRFERLAARSTGRNGAEPPTDGFLHPERWQDLCTTLQNQGMRDVGKTEKIAGFNYQKLSMQTSAGPIDIWSDPAILPSAMFLCNFEYIEAFSYDGFPGLVDEDGNSILRVGTANDYEVRAVCYPLFQVRGPGMQARCSAA